MWNTPAIILLAAGFITFGIVFAGAGALFGESDVLAGVAAIIASLVVIAGDLLYFRRGDDPELGRWRYVSLDAGGVVGFFPAWAFGLVAFGCGIALIVQGLN